MASRPSSRAESNQATNQPTNMRGGEQCTGSLTQQIESENI